MQHVVTEPHAPFSAAGGRLTVRMVPSWQDNLIWLVTCNSTGETVAVDGPEAEGVLAACDAAGLTLGGILNTHTHADHIGINVDLEGRGRLDSLRVVGAKARAGDIPGLTEPVEDGDVVRIGAVQGRALLTEGHIDGHVSYVFDDVVFCGDTLFAGGCGYLFDGPPQKMAASLRALTSLGEGTRVCCAHEYTQDNLRFAWSVEPDNEALGQRIRDVWATRAQGRSAVPGTIGDELATNPFVRASRGLSARITAAVQEAFPEREVASDDDVFAATRALKDRKDYKARGDEGLPLE